MTRHDGPPARDHRTRARLAAALTSAALALGTLAAAAPRARQAPNDAAPARPKLLVVLVVDQMRGDYVDRYGQAWTGGLRRLVDEGAWFRQARYPYLNTVTCAGHATVGTGAFPRTHGIILNAWYDRQAGRETTCVSDPKTTLVSYGAPGETRGSDSAWRLEVPTLADVLRAELHPAPRVVTMSLKARAAIMLAGHGGTAVTWMEGNGWATSSAFADAPVPFVSRFVQANPVANELDGVWNRSLDPGAYWFADDGLGERPLPGWSRTFPHPLDGGGAGTDAERWERWRRSPFSDAWLGRLAEAAVDELKLGQGPGLDYLGVSFSALDLVGHRFGPRSQEVQDVLAGVDRTVGRLLAHLDRTVGRGRYVVALTGDHGVAPIPEQMAALGLDAGHVNTRHMKARLEAVLETWLGPGAHLADLDGTDVYFAPGVFDRLRRTPAALRAVVAAIESEPGIWKVYRSDEVRRASAASNDPLMHAAAESDEPARSGDLLIVPRPNWILSSEATTHGSANQYDQRVPLLLMGAGIQPGQYLTPASPADIAPTLALLAGVTLPRPDGLALREALARPAR